jgi:uncharacterized RDD family membrane protein YckC
MDSDDPGNGPEEPDGLAARLSRMALRPVREAARSGREALSGEAERAVDGVLAGPMPEHVARSLVEHHVVERVLVEWLEATSVEGRPRSPEQERLEQLLEQRLANAVGSRLTERLVAQVAQSQAFQHALSDVLQSPEVRAALTRQTAGFGSDLAASLRSRAAAADDAAEARVQRALGRVPRAAAAAFGGLASRGVALVVDAVLAHTAFLVVAGSIALIASLARAFHTTWLTGSLLGAGWAVVVASYFVFFWSTTGQTPGLRLMGLRVVTGSGRPPVVWRSLVRLVGLILAIIPLGAGFLPVLVDGRRRALQDYLAGTGVQRVPVPDFSAAPTQVQGADLQDRVLPPA